MKSAFFLLTLLVVGCAADIGCLFQNATPKYLEVLTLVNDQISTDPVINFQTYAVAQQVTGLTNSEIEAIRQTALSWLTTRYGIPTSNAIFDPSSNVTVIPGYGTVLAITVTSGYNVVANNQISLPMHANLFEFVFFPNSGSTWTYGGTYAAEMTARGLSITPGPSDTVASGQYLFFAGSCTERVAYVNFGNKYPEVANAATFTYEEMEIQSSTWGPGFATVSARTGLTADNKSVTLFVNTMIFKPVVDTSIIAS
jgi:hypothetical protein